MFKNKHQFTCPDVIYLLDRQKKMNRIAIAINAIFFGGLMLAGWNETRKLEAEIPDTPESLVNNEV